MAVARLQQTPGAAHVLLQDADACIATWCRTVICVYRGPASVEHVTIASKQCRALIERNAGPTTYLSIIERSSPAPTEEVRRALAVWSRDVVTQMAAAVIVGEGGGFKNAIVRGVGIALTALIPHKVPFKFSSSVTEGVQLISRYLPAEHGGAAALQRAIEQVRASWV
jgi:hypothetical protein